MQILSGHANRVNDVAFSSNGEQLASCSTDGTVRIWDCTTGRSDVLHQIDHTPLHELGSIGFAAGSGLLIRPRYRGLQAWNLRTRACAAALVDETVAVHGFALHPAGTLVAVLDWSRPLDTRVIRLWDTATWKELPQHPLPDNYAARGLAFDSSGTRLATSSGVVDVRTGAVDAGVSFKGDTLLWSPDGALIAATRYGGKAVEVFASATGAVVGGVTLGGKEVQDFAFSTDARWLAVVSNEETVRAWSTRTWEERPALGWGIGKLKCLAFSPDGTRAACGSQRGTILVWDWE